jgi:hypothetical protein
VSKPQRQGESPDKLKVQAGPAALSIEVSGGAGARAGHAFLDLLSPFTSAAGLIGDRLNHLRQRAAISALVKARKQLDAEGIAPAEIPPKILLPWVEGASLETDDSNSLTEAWAGLFVRAVKSADAVTISYIETLRRLGLPEAKLIEFLATDTSPVFSRKFYESGDKLLFSKSAFVMMEPDQRISDFLQNERQDSDVGDFFESFAIQFMAKIIFYSISERRMIETKFFKENEHAIANLEHLGLIYISTEFFKINDIAYEVKWLKITKFAFDLVWACNGRFTGNSGRDRP